MKKTALLLIILMLTVCLLAGCNQEETAPATEAVEETVPAQDTDAGTTQAEPVAEIPEGTSVTSFDEFKAAASDTSATTIIIQGDVDVNEEGYAYEPENGVLIYIAQGASFVVSTTADIDYCNVENYGTFAVSETGDLLMMGGENENNSLVNNGTIEVAGKFALPLLNLENNGTISIKGTGSVEAAQMTYDNYGDFTIENGGSLDLSKGCAFNNNGVINNNGNVLVDDGGSLDNTKGSIVNEGTIDIYTYFNGDMNSITGGGTVNDYREEE